MSVNFKKLTNFEANYTITAVPPPYSHQYTLKAWPEHGHLNVHFVLTYLERDTITEEEILEEGFTKNDDFDWQGHLPKIWEEALIKMLEDTIWSDKNPDEMNPSLYLKMEDKEGHQFSGVPNNNEGWEYFLQEMIQAIYEVSKKESPLVIRFRQVDGEHEITRITILPMFANRHVEIIKQATHEEDRKKMLPWDNLKPLLREIYMPDYNYDKAIAEEPTKPGKYIDHGENLWFKFNEGVTNPGNKYNALEKIEEKILNLF